MEFQSVVCKVQNVPCRVCTAPPVQCSLPGVLWTMCSTIGGGNLAEDKIDVDKFGSPPSYQIFPSILRMLCARMCAPDTSCRGGFLRATCSVSVQHGDVTRCQLTLTLSVGIRKEQ